MPPPRAKRPAADPGPSYGWFVTRDANREPVWLGTDRRCLWIDKSGIWHGAWRRGEPGNVAVLLGRYVPEDRCVWHRSTYGVTLGGKPDPNAYALKRPGEGWVPPEVADDAWVMPVPPMGD